MQSTGREGFLLFGPYIQLLVGCYVACLQGYCKPKIDSTIWIDIVCDKSSRILAQCDISENKESEWIVELPFELDETVNDLEVRLWITADVLVRFEALHIVPGDSTIKMMKQLKASLATEIPVIDSEPH